MLFLQQGWYCLLHDSSNEWVSAFFFSHKIFCYRCSRFFFSFFNFFFFFLYLLFFDFLWYSCWSLWWLWLVFDGMMCHELFLYWLFWNSWPTDLTTLVHSVLQLFVKIPQCKDNVIFKEFWCRPFLKLAYYREKSLI